MYASVLSVALVGGDVRIVRVEAYVGGPKEGFKLSGLPDAALREARDRVRAAINSSGVDFPRRQITVNLAPADLKKRGSDYDLPIALCILAAANDFKPFPDAVMVGELALDGKVRPGGSALGAAVLGARLGVPSMVAADHATQAAVVANSRVYPVGTLEGAIALLASGLTTEPAAPEPGGDDGPVPCLSEVRGQRVARRALEIAAAGGHHMLLHGPPGGGKTMLARRLPGILPRLDPDQSIEVALIRSNAGLGDAISALAPFRAPHHTATRAALVGGGTGIPTPGEISLAHRGVLFLDELAEFPRSHLDALRQPLEGGDVVIARQGSSVKFPARFQLVGATNPCPCGYWGDDRKPCICTPPRDRYRQRISGPLLDRFDLAVQVKRVDGDDFHRGGPGEPSGVVAERVLKARTAQSGRSALNRQLGEADIRSLPIASSARRLLLRSLESGAVTARGFGKVRRVAQTIADLAGVEVGEDHVAEAFSLRGVW